MIVEMVVEALTQYNDASGTRVEFIPADGSKINPLELGDKPRARIEISITNPVSAALFKPGNTYQVNFSFVPPQPV